MVNDGITEVNGNNKSDKHRFTEAELESMPREERLRMVRERIFAAEAGLDSPEGDSTKGVGRAGGDDSIGNDKGVPDEQVKVDGNSRSGDTGSFRNVSDTSHSDEGINDVGKSDKGDDSSKGSSKSTSVSDGETEYFPKDKQKVFRENKSVVFIMNSVIIAFLIFFFAIDFTTIGIYQKNSIRLMDSLCDHVVERLGTKVEESDDFSALNELTSEYMEGYAEIQNMQFFLCNSAGKCIISTQNYQGNIDSINLSAKQQSSLKKTRKFDPSLAGIVASTSFLSRGKSFSVSLRGIKEDYYLLVIYQNSNFSKFYRTVIFVSLGLFVICTLFVLLCIYLVHRSYAWYFTGYSKVVQDFAKDDFSKRLAVPSYQKSDYFVEMLEATNQLAENIETSETRRKQFISNISHELRTPMTSICGFVDGMLDGTIPKSEYRKYLTIVSQETRRLKNMIQSMLNLTRIESGTLRLPKAEFNLTDVVVRTLLLFEHGIEEKKVDVECNADVTYRINGNQDYIQQVVYNIIENAVKFVNENGKITVSVNKDPSDDYYVDISVKNTGEGLSSDEIPHIFERFYKTDKSRSKDKTGLGLGLTICKRIVHLHDGRILVRSVAGEYTEFVIQLPYIKKGRSLLKSN